MRLRRWLFALLAVLVLPFVAVLGFGVYLEKWGRVDRAQKSDAIMIFGAKVYQGGVPSPLLRARTRHAFELWKRGMAPKIVCTGGVGEYPPAESMVETRLLREWGVPETDILREERSTSTRENALYASKLLPQGATVIAVSDPFHVWRCRRDCRRVGLNAVVSSELDGWDELPLRSRVFYCVREAVLVVRDSLFR